MIIRFFLIIWLISFLQCELPNRKNDHRRNVIAELQKPEKEIPVLCYHNIRTILDDHSPELTVRERTFDAQMQMLSDSGYHTILPDQLYDYLTRGAALPPKPIMLSFDDSHEAHFSFAAREMKKWGFKGVFFVMTVAIDKPGYLNREEIKALADEGHTIACHTYDHPLLTKLPDNEWTKEIDGPKKLLEKITGKPVDYFAYPYGEWNDRAIDELKKHGIKAAFQLSERQSFSDPLYTLRRIMVSDTWSLATLEREIHTAFDQKKLAYSERR